MIDLVYAPQAVKVNFLHLFSMDVKILQAPLCIPFYTEYISAPLNNHQNWYPITKISLNEIIRKDSHVRQRKRGRENFECVKDFLFYYASIAMPYRVVSPYILGIHKVDITDTQNFFGVIWEKSVFLYIRCSPCT